MRCARAPRTRNSWTRPSGSCVSARASCSATSASGTCASRGGRDPVLPVFTVIIITSVIVLAPVVIYIAFQNWCEREGGVTVFSCSSRFAPFLFFIFSLFLIFYLFFTFYFLFLFPVSVVEEYGWIEMVGWVGRKEEGKERGGSAPYHIRFFFLISTCIYLLTL